MQFKFDYIFNFVPMKVLDLPQKKFTLERIGELKRHFFSFLYFRLLFD